MGKLGQFLFGNDNVLRIILFIDFLVFEMLIFNIIRNDIFFITIIIIYIDVYQSEDVSNF